MSGKHLKSLRYAAISPSKQSSHSRSYSAEEIPETDSHSRKRRHSFLDADDVVSKRVCEDYLEFPSDFQDKLAQNELDNIFEAKQYISHHIIRLMYRLDFSALCSLRKSIYKDKYPSLSLAFEVSEIDKFSNIVFCYENKSVYVEIKNVHQSYIHNDIRYSTLFTKERRSFSINSYFAGFVKHLISKSDILLSNIEYLVIYTNSGLDITEDMILRKGWLRNFYPFKFDSMNRKKCEILKDFLFTNNYAQESGFYQFSRDKTTKEELLNRLKFPPAMQRVMKERKLSQEFEREVKEAFLDKLVFAVNQPSREKLNRIVKCEIDKKGEDYIAIQQKLLRHLIAPEKHKKFCDYISGIIYKFNLLLPFLHAMFLHNSMLSINFGGKSHSNNIVVNNRGRITYVKAYNADSSIGYSQLFPSKEEEKGDMFSCGKHFALFTKELQKDIRYFIIYTNVGLNITEEKVLKKDQSNDFYPIKFNRIDILKKRYKLLRDCLCINENGLYQFAHEETTREKLLSLLKLPPSLQKEKEEGKCSNENEIEIKGKFLNKLIFAVNQPNNAGLNNVLRDEIEKDNESNRVSYNYEELHEIALRWLESHEFGLITKGVMERLLGDIKNNRSSYQDIGNNDIEKIKFATSVTTRQDTPAFDKFLMFLIQREGRKYLENLKSKGINLTSVSSILNGEKVNATKAFRDLYALWFDELGNKTQYLKTLEDEGVNLTSVSSILNGAKANAAESFKDLFNLWFDEHGNKTQYLKTLEKNGINLSNMSSILSGSGAHASSVFKGLYNLWFDGQGNRTQYLKTLEKEGINLSNMSSILHGAGLNAIKAFKDLYRLWFDKEGNKTQYLKTLEQGINLPNTSSILHGTGSNASKAFKDLYDLWFDEQGNKTQYLKTLEKEGINMANMSSILGGARANAAKAFKDLYDLWFDKQGNKTQYLKTLEKEGINVSSVSNIFHGTGFNAAKAFKGLYDLWFDEQGNKTQYFKTLKKEGINLSNMSSILSGATTKAHKAFKDLYDLWFDEQENKTHYLKNLEREKINLSNMSGILSGAGSNATKAFKKLYDLWFDEQGNKTEYLKILEKEEINIPNVSSILHGSGFNAAKAFKDLYDLWFDEQGNKTKYLKVLRKENLSLSNITDILNKSGSSAAKAFKDLFDIWFDGQGSKTQYLKTLEKEGIALSTVSSILSGAGSNAARVFKDLYNLWFDKQGNKTQYLKTLEKERIALTTVSSILHRAGSNAAKAFEELYDLWFDEQGNKKKYLMHFIEKRDRRSFMMCNLSSILSGSGAKVKDAFEKLHNAFFDDEGNETEFLNDFYNVGFKPSNLSCMLCAEGVSASSTFKKLHNVCFNEKREKTKFLNDFYDTGFSASDICTMLSGAADSLEYFHNFCCTEEAKKCLNNFLNDGFTFTNLSRIMHGARANICSALKKFHGVCFDETGNRTQLLDDFYSAGFKPNSLSKILYMSGNNASTILTNFYKSCFCHKKYLNHFLAEKELFTPKLVSKILDRIGLNVCIAFEKLHNLCFDETGNRTKYLKNLTKNNPPKMILNILYEEVRKTPATVLYDTPFQQRNISDIKKRKRK